MLPLHDAGDDRIDASGSARLECRRLFDSVLPVRFVVADQDERAINLSINDRIQYMVHWPIGRRLYVDGIPDDDLRQWPVLDPDADLVLCLEFGLSKTVSAESLHVA